MSWVTWRQFYCCMTGRLNCSRIEFHIQTHMHVHVPLRRALLMCDHRQQSDRCLCTHAGFFFGVRRSIKRFAFQDDELLWDPANRIIYQVCLAVVDNAHAASMLPMLQEASSMRLVLRDARPPTESWPDGVHSSDELSV